MSELEIREEPYDLALSGDLEDRMYAYNVERTGIDDGRMLALVVRDANGRCVAGALGHTWGGTCEIKTLWVDAPLRHSGLGRALMLRAIAEAERRGCTQVLLSTHSFQAPGFYAKLGFSEVSRVENYPRGHAQILLVKALTERKKQP
jgi:ribosomal protein S18 acetylase RimI-like enzyme